MQTEISSKEETYLILKYGADYEKVLVSREIDDADWLPDYLEAQVCHNYYNRLLEMFDSR